MNLYDMIPENLFSMLASPNKYLYVKALFVLLEAFNLKLKIKKSELAVMIANALSDELSSADFSDETFLDNEKGSLSGMAYFLIRKLKSDGWITIETELDFEDYVSLPSYSIKIIQLLYELANKTETDNFTYVYSTYSSLKTADETGSPFEMYSALCDSYKRTEMLVESLKAAYHSIASYHQKQIDSMDTNTILKLHYFDFHPEITEKILNPLKIKDSVPRYKSKIINTLKEWETNNERMEKIVDYLLSSNKFTSKEDCINELRHMMFYIIDIYSDIETSLIYEVDKKNRQYTRATTKKIEYLLNADESFKGTLISLIKFLSDENVSNNALQAISNSIELFEVGFIDEKSVFEKRKHYTVKTTAPVEIVDDEDDFKKRANEEAQRLMRQKFSKENVYKFVEDMLGDKTETSTSEIIVNNDDTYLMTLFAAAYSTAKNSSYAIEMSDDIVEFDGYTVPNIKFIRRNKE